MGGESFEEDEKRHSPASMSISSPGGGEGRNIVTEIKLDGQTHRGLGALPRPRRAAGPDSPGAGRGRRAAPWLSVEEGLGSGGVGQHHNLWTASSRMVTFFSLRNVAVRGGGGGSGTSPTKLAQPLGRRSPPAPGPVGASRGSEAARSVPSEGE